MGKLSEASKTKLKNEIEVTLINEVSMIFTIRLLQIHKRICEIYIFFNKINQNQICSNIVIFLIEKVLKGTPEALIEDLNLQIQSSKCGLAYFLRLKRYAQVMLTVNLDLTDCLINGQLGNVDNICFTGSHISKIYVKIDDSLVGNSDAYCKSHKDVPTKTVEAPILSLLRKMKIYIQLVELNSLLC